MILIYVGDFISLVDKQINCVDGVSGKMGAVNELNINRSLKIMQCKLNVRYSSKMLGRHIPIRWIPD